MKKTLFVLAAVITGSQLFSQTLTDSVIAVDQYPTTELTRVIVTAHKTEQRQSTTGKVMNVITAAQIDQSRGRTVAEVLNAVPGISINGANNNLGTNLTVNIRGASAGNALILVDGIPVNDPSVITNYYDLNLIPVDQVERIEILKGGQSTLYGSDAVAGVINIITKKAKKKTVALNAGTSAGSYATFRNNIGVSGMTKHIGYNVQYSNVFSNGFSSAHDSTGNSDFDKDGFNQHVVYAGLNWQINKKWLAKISGRYSYYKTDVDAAAFTDDNDFTSSSKNWQGGAGLSYDLAGGKINLNYLYNQVTRVYTDDSTDRTNDYAYYSNANYEGITHFAELYGNYKWEHIELLAGVDFRNNKTNQDYLSIGIFPPPYTSSLKDTLANMWQLSPYASVILKNNEGLSVEAGLRWNHHSEYGSNFTYTFNPSYLINNKLKVFGNIYSSFKAPTLYQLFDQFSGNKDLKAEKSFMIEGGAEYFTKAGFTTRLVYFYRNTKDAIQFLLVDPTFFTYQYRNINKQKNEGIEWEGNYKTGRWQFAANYTFTSGKTISGYDETGSPLGKDTTYNNLYRIPKHTVNLSAGVTVKKLFIQLRAKTVSKRYEAVYGSTPQTLDAYYTVDLYSDYSFSGKWKIFIDLKNITDQEYFDILGYNSRRFNFMAGISLNL